MKLSFDTIIVLIIAILLDLVGLILLILDFFGIGVALSFIPDIIGFFTIGLWSILLKGGKAKGGLMKVAQKLGLASGAELIPFLGDISPSWTLFVLSESGLKIPFLS